MNRECIPEPLRRFILADIPSVPFLEATLLLRRNGERTWDSGLLAMELYVDELAAGALLEELRVAGVLAMDEGKPTAFRYAPSSEDLRQMIDLLAESYAQHLVEISDLIHSRNGRREQANADSNNEKTRS